MGTESRVEEHRPETSARIMCIVVDCAHMQEHNNNLHVGTPMVDCEATVPHLALPQLPSYSVQFSPFFCLFEEYYIYSFDIITVA